MRYDAAQDMEAVVRTLREELDRAWADGRDADVVELLRALGYTDVCIAPASARRRDATAAVPALVGVQVYWALRRHLGKRSVCRFAPSCSHFAYGAFVRYPAQAALRMIVNRLARCDDTVTGFDLPDWDHVVALDRIGAT